MVTRPRATCGRDLSRSRPGKRAVSDERRSPRPRMSRSLRPASVPCDHVPPLRTSDASLAARLPLARAGGVRAPVVECRLHRDGVPRTRRRVDDADPVATRDAARALWIDAARPAVDRTLDGKAHGLAGKRGASWRACAGLVGGVQAAGMSARRAGAHARDVNRCDATTCTPGVAASAASSRAAAMTSAGFLRH